MVKTLLIFLLLGQAGYKVEKIGFEGLRWTSPQALKSSIPIPLNTTVSTDVISGTIRRLVQSEFYDYVAVYSQPLKDGGVKLIFQIKENPILWSWTFIGNKKLKSGVLKDSLNLRRGTPVSGYNMFKWKKRIKDLYFKKGYMRAEVDIKINKIDSLGHADVEFDIREGKKYRIKKIVFVGNKHLSDKFLLKKLKTHPKSWLHSGKFEEDKWEKDIAKILEKYRNNGFPEAKIDSTKMDYEGKWLYITVYITEGKKFIFGNYSIEGNTVYPDSLLLSRIKIKPGKPYSQKLLNKSIEGISELYSDSGYLYINVTPIEDIRQDSILDITFRIHEGNRVKVRLVNIEGNTKTYDRVIRREIDLIPGNYFSRALAIKSQRDLFYLNYFENVTLDFSPTPDSNYIDINFKVKEKSTGKLGMGANYSKATGAFLSFNMTEPNFLGKGQNVSVLLEYGGSRRNVSFSFTEPWYKGTPNLIGTSIYSVSDIYPDYTYARSGASVTYGRPLWNDYWRVSVTYKMEKTSVYNIAKGLLKLPAYKHWYEKSPLFTSELTTKLTWDTRDRIYNGTTGHRVSYTFDLFGGPIRSHYLRYLPVFNLGIQMLRLIKDFKGEVNIHKHLFEYVQYVPNHSDKFISVFRIFTGFVTGIYNPMDVPFYERFFLGDVGPFGLRGYPARSVGPVENGYVVGGREFFIGTFEERYRFNDRIYALVFAEGGDAWRTINDVDPFKLKTSVGFGFRMEVPMLGVIGVDLGYGLQNRGGQWVTHLQIGNFY